MPTRDGLGGWAVETDDGGFVGMVGLEVIRFEAPFTPAVEIGWRFAWSHWGEGLALEAARVAMGIRVARSRPCAEGVDHVTRASS